MSIKVIMVVHVYGRRVDMDVVHEIAERHGLLVVEDLAEAHGVRPHSKTHAACHSFYRNKIIAGEEGGAVWFRDPEHTALARQLRSLGFTDAHDYDHVPRGHNYRMSNLHAEAIYHPRFYNSIVGYPMRSVERREIDSWYDATCPPEWRQPTRDAVWVYDVRVPGLTRDRMLTAVRALRAAAVEARPGFLPMHAQREFVGCRRVGGTNADRAADEVLYLPVQPGVTTLEYVRLAFNVLRREVERTDPR